MCQDTIPGKRKFTVKMDTPTLLSVDVLLPSDVHPYSHRRSCPYRTVGQLPQLLRGTKPPSPFFPAIRDRGCPKAWRRLYSGSLLLLHQLGCRKHIDSKLLFSSACACWFLQELSANSVQGVRVWDFAGQIDGELQQAPPRPLGVRRIPPKGDSVAKTSLLFVAH